MLDVLTIKVKVGIPESFKVGLYPHKITGSSHLKANAHYADSNSLPKFSILMISL